MLFQNNISKSFDLRIRKKMGGNNSRVADESNPDPPPVYYSPSLEILDNLQFIRVQQQMPRDLKGGLREIFEFMKLHVIYAECCHGNSYKMFDENGATILRALESMI